jgi:hypothetical protein
MRRLLWVLLAITLVAAAFGGCAKEASSDLPSASASVSSGAPIPTTAPDAEAVSASPGNGGEGSVTVDGWTYYLNEEDAATINYGEDPTLRRKTEDGGSDEDLRTRGFAFDIIGDYIYLDSNYPNLDTNGNQTWYTTRMSLDGSEQRRLEYGSMSTRLVLAQKFYFTVAGDSAIYVSDFACEDVAVLPIALPDVSDLDKKLASDREMQLDVDSVAGGWITFIVTFVTPEGIQMYKGTYKMAEDGSGAEKVSGTYYDYESLESELD